MECVCASGGSTSILSTVSYFNKPFNYHAEMIMILFKSNFLKNPYVKGSSRVSLRLIFHEAHRQSMPLKMRYIFKAVDSQTMQSFTFSITILTHFKGTCVTEQLKWQSTCHLRNYSLFFLVPTVHIWVYMSLSEVHIIACCSTFLCKSISQYDMFEDWLKWALITCTFKTMSEC